MSIESPRHGQRFKLRREESDSRGTWPCSGLALAAQIGNEERSGTQKVGVLAQRAELQGNLGSQQIRLNNPG